MSRVKVDISMSLDGYIDAGGVTPEAGLGRGGEILHQYGMDGDRDDLDAQAVERAHAVGALICGRRTYDLSVPFWGPHGPSGPEQRVPTFVLTHSEPDHAPEDSVYRFVRGEPEHVLAQALETVGDREISVMGGANAIQQFVSAGLADEIHIHQVPVLFGAGTRLFELELARHVRLEHERVDVSPAAVHLVYRVAHS
jgi:dihydrofolate reductase